MKSYVVLRTEINCDACTVVLGGSYEYHGLVIDRDNVAYQFHDRTLCSDCNKMLRRRGWLVKELRGKYIDMVFKDGAAVALSRERFARLNMRQTWPRVKAQAVFYSNLTGNIVQLVKVYSRPDFPKGVGNGVVKVVTPIQLRMDGLTDGRE